jgi:hypothetical protein
MPTAGPSVTSALDPWALQDRISTVDARYALASLLMPIPGSSTIAYRSGVFAAGDSPAATVGESSHLGMKVTPGSGLQLLVNAGNCALDTASNGPYMCALDSQKTLSPIAPRSATLNRYDLVMARVYDDQNSAIGSPANTRKFDVQVWQGDGASGVPTIPNSGAGFPAAGWHPLAAVYMGKGSSTTIPASDITDLRGPGLVARGGNRMLFGSDALISSAQFTAAGAYPGDMRWVHGNAFPLQVYWGGNSDTDVAGWRGVENGSLYQAIPVGGTTWVTGGGSVGEVCRVTIPYPGTPYAIRPTARLNGMISGGTGVELRVSLDAPNGELINFAGFDNYAHTIDKPKAMTVPGMVSGPYTAAKDIVMNVYVRDAPSGGLGVGWTPGSGGQHVLSVEIFPATIPPTKVWK